MKLFESKTIKRVGKRLKEADGSGEFYVVKKNGSKIWYNEIPDGAYFGTGFQDAKEKGLLFLSFHDGGTVLAPMFHKSGKRIKVEKYAGSEVKAAGGSAKITKEVLSKKLFESENLTEAADLPYEIKIFEKGNVVDSLKVDRKTAIQVQDMLSKFQKANKGKLKENENIEGGLADALTLDDIAQEHGVDVESLNKEVEMGLSVEMEHTDDEAVAIEIVKDHLMEDPEYYTKLSQAKL